jgi:hypothetical protein
VGEKQTKFEYELEKIEVIIYIKGGRERSRGEMEQGKERWREGASD